MAAAVVVLAFVGVLVFAIWWVSLQNKGVRPRALRTSASVDQVAAAFDQAVGGTGWKVIDPSNPRIAQSPLYTGIRQRIAMTYERSANGDLEVVISPIRVTTKGLFLRRPTKAHTLRMRMDGFERRVRRADAKTTTLDVERVPELKAAVTRLRTIA